MSNTTTVEAPETAADTVAVPREEYEMILRARQEKLDRYKRNLRDYAERAISSGASNARVNEALAELGLEPFRSSNQYLARYKVTQYVHLNADRSARTREAVEASVMSNVEYNRSHQRVYRVSDYSGYEEPDNAALEFHTDDGNWLPADQFWAAQTNAQPIVPVDDLDQLKAIARKWVLRLAKEFGFCSSGVRDAFTELALGPVPRPQTKRVAVPVTAQMEVEVTYYEGDSEADIEAAVADKQRQIIEGGRAYVNNPTPVTQPEVAASAS